MIPLVITIFRLNMDKESALMYDTIYTFSFDTMLTLSAMTYAHLAIQEFCSIFIIGIAAIFCKFYSIR